MDASIKHERWTDEELEYLGKARLAGISYSHIAKKLKRTKDACRNRWLKTNWEEAGNWDKKTVELRNMQKQALAEKSSDAVIEKFNMWRMRADVIADRVLKSVESLPPVARRVWTPKTKLGRGDEDMALVLSDLHIGHTHTLEETGGISEYSLDIFRKRLRYLEKSIANIYELHSHLYNIPNLHIFCLGDIVDGMNQVGAWSATNIDISIYDQWMTGVNELAATLHFLLTIFPKITFYGVRGNHGRIAMSGAEKDYANWDNLCYEMLKKHFCNEPRIKFEVGKSWWRMHKIRNKNFLLVHGDDIKSGGGSTLKNLEKFSASMGTILRENPDYTICGHFHESCELTTNFGRMLINGSFVGGDIYSIQKLHRCNKPEQKVFGIHDRHGITWRYDIQLEAEK